MDAKTYILTLVCPDARGIVARVAGFLADHGGFILESAQFGDESTGQFFMRTEFSTDAQTPAQPDLEERFQTEVATPFSMEWQLHDKSHPARVLIMVSKFGHCLSVTLRDIWRNVLRINWRNSDHWAKSPGSNEALFVSAYAK